eukprot:494880-Rhodomonas_salina.1
MGSGLWYRCRPPRLREASSSEPAASLSQPRLGRVRSADLPQQQLRVRRSRQGDAESDVKGDAENEGE